MNGTDSGGARREYSAYRADRAHGRLTPEGGALRPPVGLNGPRRSSNLCPVQNQSRSNSREQIMKTLIRLLFTLVPALCLAPTAFAEGDAATGESLFAICVACHGANGEGNKALNAPSNAGQDDWYVVRQLKNFKEGIRGADPKDIYGAQMRPMAMALADDQAIEDVAAYVATLSAPSPAITVDGDVGVGKQLYSTCTACHGGKGEGNKALNAPRLTGQHDWYTVRQLQNFKTGVRGAHPKDTYGAQMRPMAAILADDAAMNNVAAYIATLE